MSTSLRILRLRKQNLRCPSAAQSIRHPTTTTTITHSRALCTTSIAPQNRECTACRAVQLPASPGRTAATTFRSTAYITSRGYSSSSISHHQSQPPNRANFAPSGLTRPPTHRPQPRQEPPPATPTPPIDDSQSYQPASFLLLDVKVPPICPGCGAHGQTSDPNAPGFYDPEKESRKRAKLKKREVEEKDKMDRQREQERIWMESLGRYQEVLKKVEGVDLEGFEAGKEGGVEEVAVVEEEVLEEGGLKAGKEKKKKAKGQVKEKETEARNENVVELIQQEEVEVQNVETEVGIKVVEEQPEVQAQKEEDALPSILSTLVKNHENKSLVNEEKAVADASTESKYVPPTIEASEEDLLSEEEESSFEDELGLDATKYEFVTTDISKPTTPSQASTTTTTPETTTTTATAPEEPKGPPLELCSRCRNILNHNSMPTAPVYADLDSLLELLIESKYDKNHIYHLIDAADFPMSVIPKLRSYLTQYLSYKKARGLTISYIVTRADVLMPKEEQVTSLMTYMKNVLKETLPPGEALERHGGGEEFRVVSIRNGWSVSRIKDELSHKAGLKMSKAEKGKITAREGGVWIVGKVNVGKSRLVGEIVPAGSFTNLERVVTDEPVRKDLGYQQRRDARKEVVPEKVVDPGEKILALPAYRRVDALLEQLAHEEEVQKEREKEKKEEQELRRKQAEEEKKRKEEEAEEERKRIFEEEEMKKKAAHKQLHNQETLPFVAPVVSGLMGTTVAPLRVAFRHVTGDGSKGKVKGEIVDLPGMARGRFHEFVRPELRNKILMKEIVDAEQLVVKPGQSLLLAGLILLRPKPTTTLHYLMYSFNRLPPHVTDNDKAFLLMSHPDPSSSRIPELYQLPPPPTTTDSASTPPLKWNDPSRPIHPPSSIRLCKSIKLTHDVTRLRNPMLAKQRLTDEEYARLPYRVYSADVVLEGIGWVEVVCEVRGNDLWEGVVPEVEVWTPLGKGAMGRPPMGVDMLRLKGLKERGLFGVRRVDRKRARAPAKGRKKLEKQRRRREEGGGAAR